MPLADGIPQIVPLLIGRFLQAAPVLWAAISLTVLARWGWRTRVGWRELSHRPIRENYIQLPALLVALIVLFALNIGAGIVVALLGLARPAAAGGPPQFWAIVAGTAAELAIVPLILLYASAAFAGGLRGFGLGRGGALGNILRGLGYLFVIFPCVMLVLFGTERLFTRLQWHVKEHSLFEMVRQSGDARVMAAAVAMAVIGAPLAEELLFRGLLQSFLARFFRVMMPPKGWPSMAFWFQPPEYKRMRAEAAAARARELGQPPPMDLDAPPDPAAAGGQAEPLSPAQEGRRAYAAIIVASLLFASVHLAVPASVPAIFVLALALGYAYERTGSLITAITMHLGFNALNMTMFFATQGRS